MAGDRIFAAVTVGLLATLYFAPHRAEAGTLEAETLSHARQLLRAGQTEEADRLVHSGLSGAPDDGLLCLVGEIEFRRADFAAASSAFTGALEQNPQNARAHWGLVRTRRSAHRFRRNRRQRLIATPRLLDNGKTRSTFTIETCNLFAHSSVQCLPCWF